jgi:hypothetical protein
MLTASACNKPYVEISEVTEPKTNQSRKHYSGLEVTAETINATLVFQDTAPRNDNMWGYRLQNGTVTGSLGDVFYGRSDIVFSSMSKGLIYWKQF